MVYVTSLLLLHGTTGGSGMAEVSHDYYYKVKGGVDHGEPNDESQEGIHEPGDELLASSMWGGYLTE